MTVGQKALGGEMATLVFPKGQAACSLVFQVFDPKPLEGFACEVASAAWFLKNMLGLELPIFLGFLRVGKPTTKCLNNPRPITKTLNTKRK